MRKEEKKMRGKEKPSELGCVSLGRRRFRVRRHRSCPKQLRVSISSDQSEMQLKWGGLHQNILTPSDVKHSEGSPGMAGWPLLGTSPLGGSSETQL